MRSGFVILNYNAGVLSAKLAVKVASMKAIAQVVIVNNHSTDNSLNDLRQVENEKIMVVVSEKMADILMILEDCQETDYSVLSGIEYDMNGRISQPLVWSMNTYWDDLAGCFFLGRKLQKRQQPKTLNRDLAVQTIEIFKGSFLSVRMADFLEVGGFDDDFFLFCEERVLSTRLKNAGKRIRLGDGSKILT